MGRLDMLFADIDSKGDLQGWIVADLKIRRAPEAQIEARGRKTVAAVQRYSAIKQP